MNSFLHRIKPWPLILGVLVVSGCSVKFTYEKLGWFLPWYLDDFVSINKQQTGLLDQQIESFLQWHKQNQLPEYSNFFGCIAKQAEDGLSRSEADTIYRVVKLRINDLLKEVSHPLAELAQVLNDDQVDELFENLAERNQVFRERSIEAEEKDQRKRRAERMIKRVSRWTYDLNDAQLELITRWSNRIHLQGRAMLDARLAWQARLRNILQSRRDFDRTQSSLQALLLKLVQPDDSAEQLRYEHDLSLFKALIVDLDKSLSSYQRRHFVKRLRDYQQDFLEIADVSAGMLATGDCPVLPLT